MRFLVFVMSLMLATASIAQDRRPSHCIALADAGGPLLHQASFRDPVPSSDVVRITYIDHATFYLQTHGGLEVATDFTGYLGAVSNQPDVVTMNHAHSSHWTHAPHPSIPHVLRGWGSDGARADHHLDLDEMLIRNVTTDIRSRLGTGSETDGNSIFVFEVAGLCIGHLGHLHHEPDVDQYARLGRLDVVMAAIDGGLSLDTPTMMRVLKRLRASIVIPMHWFGRSSLNAFLSGMSGDFDVVDVPDTHIEISARTLPKRPTIMVITPGYQLVPEE
ncbi:MAG: MBL fold metallo-hydrolase [Litoreibacter sp.]